MSIADYLDPHAESVPVLQLGLHVLQIVLAFVVWCLAITVFRADGAVFNSNNGWTFGVFFLSVPACIVLILLPRYPRTAKFASPRAMLAVDAVFAIIWLTAFASQAAYNTADSCGSACGISKAVVGLAFFVCLLFCATTFLAVYTVKYHDWHGHLPGYGAPPARRTHAAVGSHDPSDPDKAAFSTAPHDEEAYAPLGPAADDDDFLDRPYNTASSRHGAADPYGSVTSQVSYGARSTGPASTAATAEMPLDGEGTDYLGAGGPAPYHQPPAQFPPANYDRIGLH